MFELKVLVGERIVACKLRSGLHRPGPGGGLLESVNDTRWRRQMTIWTDGKSRQCINVRLLHVLAADDSLYVTPILHLEIFLF